MNFSLFLHAANIGFMLMFTVVVAPAVFRVLSQKAAASYLRVLFPRLFLFGFATSSAAAAISLFENALLNTAFSTMIALGFLFNALILTPQINQYRDRAITGDADAEKTFKRLHLFSVVIFVSQFFASFYVIIAESYYA